MKKISAKVLSLVLAMSSCFAVGCGGQKVADDDQTLQVYVFQAGYGTKWCTDMLELFKQQDWVKAKYPNLKIPAITENDVGNFAEGRLSAGEKGNPYDLMFSINLDYNTGPNGDFLDLTDVVYGSEVPGEAGVLWKNKSLDSYNESNTYIDPTDLSTKKQYLTSWAGGMNTILYNETKLLQFTDKLPNTTDELLKICADVKANKGQDNGKYSEGYAFMEYGTGSYFVHMFPIYWAQYEGLTNYKNFWNGFDNNRYSKGIFDQKGRLHSLEVMEDILDANNGYIVPNPAEYEFMQAQTSFLQGKTGIFFCNGDWFDNEMKTIRDQIIAENNGKIDTFKTMRMPIISELGKKLGITDAELSAIVDYVDGTTTTEPTFTSTNGTAKEEVIAAVKEARTVVHSLGPNHQAGIPHYAKAKNVAIDFLRFMATDIAQESYIRSTGGASLPFKYKLKEKNINLYNELGTMQQTRHDYFSEDAYEVYTLPSNRAFPLFQYGGVKAFTREEYFTDFTAVNKTWTAQKYYDETKKAWSDEKWSNALSLAGLNQ